jgi:hypothetical protein
MLPIVTLPVMAYYLWRGGALGGVALIGAGLVVHVGVLTRVMRAGAGPHATRALGIALVVAGIVIASGCIGGQPR